MLNKFNLLSESVKEVNGHLCCCVRPCTLLLRLRLRPTLQGGFEFSSTSASPDKSQLGLSESMRQAASLRNLWKSRISIMRYAKFGRLYAVRPHMLARESLASAEQTMQYPFP